MGGEAGSAKNVQVRSRGMSNPSLALSIERYFALRSAFGKGSLAKFVANIKAALAAGDIKNAQEICDKQRGGTS